MNSRLHILLAIESLAAAGGGPPRSVCGLAGALAADHRVTILAGGSPSDPGIVRPDPRVKMAWLGARPRGWQGVSRDALRLPRLVRDAIAGAQPDIVHDNGVWSAFNHAVAAACTRLRVPRVVATRGMLTAWSVRHKRWKKRLAWLAYQRRDLAGAALIHATAEMEVADLRALGVRTPAAVVPNGCDLPPEQILPAPLAGQYALFLSRIHPKKGLLELVDAWRQARPPGWRLVIAGPDDAGHGGQVAAAAARAGLTWRDVAAHTPAGWEDPGLFGADIICAGAVEGARKWSLLAGAGVFVLPTHSENFGLVVCEALACGVPVITTRGTPWQELETHGCGWWIEIGAAPLATALSVATASTDETRRAMGTRGRILVSDSYTWMAVARRMAPWYRGITSGGVPPKQNQPPA